MALRRTGALGTAPRLEGARVASTTLQPVPASARARVWVSPERARWAREDKRVVEELQDGAVIVDLPYGGNDYLAREILKEAGDAVVLEPEDARAAVRVAAEQVAGAVHR